MTLNKSAGIVTKKKTAQIQTAEVKKPVAKKTPPKRKTKAPAPEKTPEPKKEVVQEAPKEEAPKKVRKPRTKKNPTTKAPKWKPTIQFVFETTNGAGIGQNYLRGAGFNFRTGKIEGQPAIQIEGNGVANKQVLKSFREHMKTHRVKYTEEAI